MYELYIFIPYIIILIGVLVTVALMRVAGRKNNFFQNILFVCGAVSTIATLILQLLAIFWDFFAFLLPWDMDPPANVGRWQIRLQNFFNSGEPPFGPLFYFSAGFGLLFVLVCLIYLTKDLFAMNQTSERVERLFTFTIINLLSLPLFVFVFFLCTMVPQNWVQQSRPLSYIDVLPGGLLLTVLLIGVPLLHRKVSRFKNLVPVPNSEMT